MNTALEKFRVGLIGTGRISDIYLQNCQKFPNLEIVACGGLDLDESRAKADQYGIPKVATPDDIITDPTIDGILNLTIPAAHAGISLSALENGKHVYSEKPFVTDLQDGKRILALAEKKGLAVGNAPDTFFGGRWQTVRKILDDGVIGQPFGVFASVPTSGTERHHPNPDFYYAKGGGPLLDMGPYYLALMVFCFGSIARVASMNTRAFDEVMIENGPRYGEMMPVEVDTHCQSLLQFANGTIGQMVASFETWDSEMPRFEIHGTGGTITITDPDPCDGPNFFHGPVYVRTRDTARWTTRPRPNAPAEWAEAENTHGLNFDARGVGLSEMVDAVAHGRTPRASGAMGQHICEVIQGMFDSSEFGRFVDIQSTCERPNPLPETTATDYNISF